MYPQAECFDAFGSVRRPIQCEGIARGPERMSEIGVSGSVNPQFDWGGLADIAVRTIPDIIKLF